MPIRILLTATLLAFGLSSASAQYFGHEYEGKAAAIRKGEKPVIPLDTKDPSYNAWRTLRDFSKDKREPGILNVQKYDFGWSYNAMPTFFNYDDTKSTTTAPGIGSGTT